MNTNSETFATCFNTKEVTFIDPLIEEEALALIAISNELNIKTIVSHSRRIATFPCDELQIVIEILGASLLIENTVRIREIIDWDITHTNDDPNFIDILLKPERNDNA